MNDWTFAAHLFAASAVEAQHPSRTWVGVRLWDSNMDDRISSMDPRVIPLLEEFEPHLNYSRLHDALTCRLHGRPQFLDSWSVFTAKKAFEPYLNYSRLRDALVALSLAGARPSPHHPRFSGAVNRQLTTANRKAFEPYLNYSRSRDAPDARLPSSALRDFRRREADRR